eukprot:11213118-Lingulodinium_polyedra.AAC.1
MRCVYVGRNPVCDVHVGAMQAAAPCVGRVPAAAVGILHTVSARLGESGGCRAGVAPGFARAGLAGFWGLGSS